MSERAKNFVYPLLAAVVAAVCMVVAGCAGNPVGSSPTNNSGFDCEVLFDFDGCRVYRFRDAGRYIYFAKGASDVRWNAQSGKATLPMEVQTVAAEASE